MLTSFAPLCSSEESPQSYSVDRMTSDAFETNMMLADCEKTKGDKYMACCIMYRGDVSTLQANQAVDAVKRKKTINMVDWCGTGFKVGINQSSPGYIENSELARTNRQVTMIANSTSVQQVFGRIYQRFDKLFERRAFTKHYIKDRIEELELQMAREDLNTLNDFYDEVKSENALARSNTALQYVNQQSEEITEE